MRSCPRGYEINMEIIKNAEMSKYTSFRAGGKADLLMIPENEDELKQAVTEALDRSGKYYLIGNGTDTIVTDAGLREPVIIPGQGFADFKIDGDEIVAGPAALVTSVAKSAAAESLTGMEGLSGIPGSMGGGVFMNAGAYGYEMKDVVKSVRVMSRDGKSFRELAVDELDMSYRHSILEETGEIITRVTLKLRKGDKEEIFAKMKDLTERRVSKQPLNYPSAGSFFKRPEGYFAGKLIQDAGLKGLMVGGAQISEKHSGFMINAGGATATDIIDLMRLVQNTVMDKFGVKLEPEVRIIGEMPEN